MRQRKRIDLSSRLVVVVMLLLGLLPLAVMPAQASPAAQYGGYRPRAVTIRRLPGGRVMRIISVTRGGFVASICNQSGANAEPVYARESPTPDALSTEPVLFLPGSGQASPEIKIPLICATPTDTIKAYAVAPDGQEMPAVLVEEGSQTSIVMLPITAYLVPGTWQLVVEAPAPLTLDIDVLPLTSPRLVVGGESILLGGFQPGEAVRGIVMADRCVETMVPLTDPAEPFPPLSEEDMALCANPMGRLLTYVGEFDAGVDAGGAALIERLDPLRNLTYVFVGAAGGDALASALDTYALADALDAGDFVIDRDSLFAEDDGPVTDPLVDKVEPTPAVMPATGAAQGDAPVGLAAAGMLILAAALLAIANSRRRTPQ